MKEIVNIKLLPKDFIGNHYLDTHDCPLVRACKRHFKTNNVEAGGYEVTINNKDWIIVMNEVYNWNCSIMNAVKEKYQNPDHDTIYYVQLKKYNYEKRKK